MSEISKSILIFVLISFIIGYTFNPEKAADETYLPLNTAQNSFAVVELFTSQGCSSCPPADRQLEKIKTFAEQHNLPVYTLAFHVDYWDYLGWKDKYSAEQFSARQREYARIWQKRKIYTPQMVVNGVHEFVGSNEKICTGTISTELLKSTERPVQITAEVQDKKNTFLIDYQFNRKVNGFLNIAVLQKKAEDRILDGENKGELLTGHNIVRVFKEVNCTKLKKGHISIHKPADLQIREMRIVLYLQNKVDRRIEAATQLEL